MMSANPKNQSDATTDIRGGGGVTVCPWSNVASSPPPAQDFADIVRQQQRQAKNTARSTMSQKSLSWQEEFELGEALLRSLQLSTDVDIDIERTLSTSSTVKEESTTDMIKDMINAEILDTEADSGECKSDAVIAQMMQAQYDREYNDDLRRRERNYNKDAKVTVCLDKYKRSFLRDVGEREETDDVEWDGANALDPATATDWDRFETNERLMEAIPRCGYMLDKEGEWMTKHDLNLNGVRNVRRLMSFPLEFATGDGAGFDMKLSNKVFNQLKVYSNKHQRKANKMQDRKDNVATAEKAVDQRTRLLLYKLISNGMLGQIHGVISTGKEALILHATIDPNELCSAGKTKVSNGGGGGGVPGVLLSSTLPTQWTNCNCALKIFKTTLNDFKQRDRYIKDDYRFKDRFNVRFSRQNNGVIINMWAEKEWHNLIRMNKAGIRCPTVLWLKDNIIMMTLIGNGPVAAEKLKHADMSPDEWEMAYGEVVTAMYRLYNNAKLVHADLNEYNILWYEDHCWLIDVAQAVEPQHPNALQFLMNDCNNIVNFFRRKNVVHLQSKDELFQFITGINTEHMSAAMLERLYTKGEHVMTGQEILTYPFDVAWELSTSKKNETNEKKKKEEEGNSVNKTTTNTTITTTTAKATVTANATIE